jgi:hypothetical protein
MRHLVRFPWAADSCPWVGKLRTVLPLNDRVIRDSAVPLGLTHQRGANGVDSYLWVGRVLEVDGERERLAALRLAHVAAVLLEEETASQVQNSSTK